MQLNTYKEFDMKLTNKFCRQLASVLILTCFFAGCYNMNAKEKTSGNKIHSWTHINGTMPRDWNDLTTVATLAKKAGYEAVLLRLRGQEQGKHSQQAVIRYLKKSGLKVFPEIKLLGKSHITFGKKFMSRHKDLFIGNLVDPFAEYKGEPALNSLILPEIKKIIELFETPDFFFLGWDETHTDNIKAIGDRHNKSICDVWAGTLNAVTEYLISRGITPVIFGDQLLSTKLAEKNNPLCYPPDKRFKTIHYGPQSLNSAFPPGSNSDLLGCIKQITNKNKIIVADWHYGPAKEYPSIDYFQWLGFKNVIPVTWNDNLNMKYFSQYAQSRGCDTMLATYWYHFVRRFRWKIWPILMNSIRYFKNPALAVPPPATVRVLHKGNPVTIVTPGDVLELQVLPQAQAAFELYPYTPNVFDPDKVTKLRSDSGSLQWKVPEKYKGELLLVAGYSIRNDGYWLNGVNESLILVSQDKKTRLTEQVAKNAISKPYMDIIPQNTFTLNGNKLIAIAGKSPSRYGWLEGDVNVEKNSLIFQKGGILLFHTKKDISAMLGDRTVDIDFSIDKFPTGWAGLVCCGGYGNGFRIIITKNKHLFVQMSGEKNGKLDRVQLVSIPLELKRKYKVRFQVIGNSASLYVNGKLCQKSSTPSLPIAPSQLLWSVGCSFGAGKRNFFEGKIYRVTLYDSTNSYNSNKTTLPKEI